MEKMKKKSNTIFKYLNIIKTYKIHLFYLVIIMIVLLISNYEKVLMKFFDFNSEGYMELKTDIEIINPHNGEVVGQLKKGIVLKYPSIDDLDDTDLGDNDRFKLLLDLEDIKRVDRKYYDLDSKQDIFQLRSSYNSYIARKAKVKKPE